MFRHLFYIERKPMSINPFPDTEIEQLLKKSEFILETGIAFLSDTLKKRGILNDAFLPLLNKALEDNALDTAEKRTFFIEGALPDAKEDSAIDKSIEELVLASKVHHDLALIERYEKLIAKQKEDATQLTEQEVADLTLGSGFLDEVQKAVEHLSSKTPIDAINKSYDELSALKKTKEELEKKAEEAKEEENKEPTADQQSLINPSAFKAKAEEIDWIKFREEVIWKQLDNILKERPADMGLTMVQALLIDTPAIIINFFLKHYREAKKKKAKAEKENRANHIKACLDSRGGKMTRNDLISRLAIEAKQWIMDDKIVRNFPNNRANLSPYQRAQFKKWLFSTSLPLTKDFDLDFNRFTKAQKKQYKEYLRIYANIEPWVSKSNILCGVKLSQSERQKDVDVAFSMNIKGGLDKDMMRARQSFFRSFISPHRSWFRRRRKGYSFSREA